MENLELKTPSGYTITIKSDLTYGQFNELTQMIAGEMKFDVQTKQLISSEVEGKIVFAAQEKAKEMLIVKIVDPQGNEVTNKIEAINEMPREDGEMITKEVNRIREKSQLPKKGGT